ncbi:MAG: hypothetical protein ACRDQA_11915 [Nocardioidaceae bacterium]
MATPAAAIPSDWAQWKRWVENELRRVSTVALSREHLTVVDGTFEVQGKGQIIAGDPEGGRTELTPKGFTVYDEAGREQIDLTVSGHNQILISKEGKTVASISSDGTVSAGQGNFDSLFVGGDSLTGIITDRHNELTDEEDPTPPPSGSTVTKHQTWEANWAQAYNIGGNQIAGDPTQGYYSGTNGNQRSMIGFPEGAIQAATANATEVFEAHVYLYFHHWYANAGGTAVVGFHDSPTPPAHFSGSPDLFRFDNWPNPGGRWVNITGSYDTNAWKGGTRTGITLGPGPTFSRTYYGTAYGPGGEHPPRLKLTWKEVQQ